MNNIGIYAAKTAIIDSNKADKKFNDNVDHAKIVKITTGIKDKIDNYFNINYSSQTLLIRNITYHQYLSRGEISVLEQFGYLVNFKELIGNECYYLISW